MSVTGMYRRYGMPRQMSEAVVLENASVATIINTKKDWNCVQLLQIVVDDNKDGAAKHFWNAMISSRSPLRLLVCTNLSRLVHVFTDVFERLDKVEFIYERDHISSEIV